LLSVRSFAAFGGVCALFGTLSGTRAAAEEGMTMRARLEASRPVVVEMFVSQACSASPPAAELLTRLADRTDIVALAWHVDYWDDYPGRGVGPWKDPFAQPEFSARQLAYNMRFKGRAVKMTPQTVIDGVITLSRSKREIVENKIREAQFLDEMARPSPPRIVMRAAENRTIRARIENVGAPYDALVVNFRPAAETAIEGGDNAGAMFREANVVRSVSALARGHAGAGDFSFEAPQEGLGCAVIVQERNQGRIVAARYCVAAENQ